MRTACERPRIPGLLENLVAMMKRNMNTPDLAGTVDITNMSISSCNSVIRFLYFASASLSAVSAPAILSASALFFLACFYRDWETR